MTLWMMTKQMLYVTRQRCAIHKWYSHVWFSGFIELDETLWCGHCIGTKSAVFIKENERLCVA